MLERKSRLRQVSETVKGKIGIAEDFGQRNTLQNAMLVCRSFNFCR